MPDFASTFQMANRPTVPLESPMDAQARALQLQGMMGQQQLQQGQIQQQGIQNQMLQQQFNDTQRVRAAIQNAAQSPGDPMANITQSLEKDGSPTALQYLGSITTMGKNMAQLDTAKLALGRQKLTLVGNAIGTAATPQEAAQAIQYHVQNGDLPINQAQNLMASLRNASSDPNSYKLWQKTQASALDAAQSVLSLLMSKTTVQGINAVTVDPLTNQATAKPIPGIQPEIVGVHADPNNTAFGVDKYGHAVPILDASGQPQKMRPPAAIIMNQPIGVSPAVGRGETGPQVLDTLAPGVRGVVQAIVEGRQSPPGGFAQKTPYWQGIMQNVYAVDPQWSEQRAQIRKSFMTGKQGDNIGALNTASVHLDAYLQAAQALANGNFQPGNAIYNKISTMLGAPAPTTFEGIKNAVAGEQANALKGSATDIEINHIAQTMNAANSPAQFMDAGKAALGVMRQKLQTYQERYHQANPGDTSWSPVLPSAGGVFQKYGITAGAPAAQPSPQNLPTIASPSDPAFKNLASGAHFIGPDGVERVKH